MARSWPSIRRRGWRRRGSTRSISSLTTVPWPRSTGRRSTPRPRLGRRGAPGRRRRPRPRSPLDRRRSSRPRARARSAGRGVPELDSALVLVQHEAGAVRSACQGTGIEGGPEGGRRGARAGRAAPAVGSRLSAVPRRVQVHGETYADLTARDVTSVLERARGWRFHGERRSGRERLPHAEPPPAASRSSTRSGSGYLALDRPGRDALGGGRCSAFDCPRSSGAGSTGALYVLPDEPTIESPPARHEGAPHANLRALVAGGSTVIVVEHDAETIRAADHVLDLGPGGGRNGGHIMSEGPAARVLSDPQSPTARALAESARVERPKRPLSDRWIELGGASAHNLKDVTFRVPVGRMCVVAGVSGSGKSTLVRHVFYPALRRALGLVADEPGEFKSLKGHKVVQRALAVDPVATESGGRPAPCPPHSLACGTRSGSSSAALPRREDARLHAGSRFLLQHAERRAVHGVRWARVHRLGDGVLAGRRRPLRGVRGGALRAVDPRRSLRRALDWRRLATSRPKTPPPPSARTRGDCPSALFPPRPRGGLRPDRAGLEHALGRRGATPEVGRRAVRRERPRADRLRSRRTDDRAPPSPT